MSYTVTTHWCHLKTRSSLPCHAECTNSIAVDTGKHAESTTDQAPTPHAELLLMRVLAQSAIAANEFNIEKFNNENTVLTVFA